MVVYADILVLLNLLVDYFLLLLTAKLLHKSITLARQITAAAVGAFSSLMIFLPEYAVYIQIFLYTLPVIIMARIAFGKTSLRSFLKEVLVFLAVSCFYAGSMLCIWYLFKPHGMVIHNSIVYFNISPVFLIVFSALGYIIITLLRGFLERRAPLAKSCRIKLFAEGKQIEISAIADTGNSLEDIFGTSEIIIADPAAAEALLGDYTKNPTLRSRYRALPVDTVTGTDLLDGYRCDKAYITQNERTVELRKPILAISKSPLGGDYSAIINPKILD